MFMNLFTVKMRTGKKELSLLQGDKRFVERVLSRSSSVGVGAAAIPGRSARYYYAGANVEVPFVWEEQPGKPKDHVDESECVLTPPQLQRQLSLSEADAPSSYFYREAAWVPFQWELQPGRPIDLSLGEEYLAARQPDTPSPPRRARVYSPCTERREEEVFRPRLHHHLEEVKQSRPRSPRPPPMLTLTIPNVCASPMGSARWIKGIFQRKMRKLSKKVSRVRSEPREGNPGKGRFRVSVSDRFDRYYFSNSDDDYTLPSSGSSNSTSVESPVGSRRTVGPLVHSSKFRVLAKGLAKWVKL